MYLTNNKNKKQFALRSIRDIKAALSQNIKQEMLVISATWGWRVPNIRHGVTGLRRAPYILPTPYIPIHFAYTTAKISYVSHREYDIYSNELIRNMLNSHSTISHQ